MVKTRCSKAEELEALILPGFAVTRSAHHEDGTVAVFKPVTWVLQRWFVYTITLPGYELHAKYTPLLKAVVQLGKRLIAKYNLDKDADPQNITGSD